MCLLRQRFDRYRRRFNTDPGRGSKADALAAPGAVQVGRQPRSVERFERGIEAIARFVAGWNERAYPFVWTKTANQVLAKPAKDKPTSRTEH